MSEDADSTDPIRWMARDGGCLRRSNRQLTLSGGRVSTIAAAPAEPLRRPFRIITQGCGIPNRHASQLSSSAWRVGLGLSSTSAPPEESTSAARWSSPSSPVTQSSPRCLQIAAVGAEEDAPVVVRCRAEGTASGDNADVKFADLAFCHHRDSAAACACEICRVSERSAR